MIPAMTHPLSRHWDQPPAERVLVDDTHALMSPETFAALAEYSTSMPSGVYEGKMWKRRDGAFEYAQRRRQEPPEWLLCWYGPGEAPETCSVEWRRILVVS